MNKKYSFKALGLAALTSLVAVAAFLQTQAGQAQSSGITGPHPALASGIDSVAPDQPTDESPAPVLHPVDCLPSTGEPSLAGHPNLPIELGLDHQLLQDRAAVFAGD